MTGKPPGGVRGAVEEKIKNYKRALKYLDSCGELSYEKLCEAHRIAGLEAPESELRMMWQQSVHVIGRPGRPGGTEFLRGQIRSTLIEAIDTFKDLSGKLSRSNKSWWRFWR